MILDVKSPNTHSDVGHARRGKSHTGDQKMLVPVRCFSCNKIVGGAYEEFVERQENGEDPAKVMDDLGIKRYCCRKIYVSHLDLIDELLPYD